MTTIKAECIAKSKHPDCDLTVSTVIATYPRWIHAEARTHRLLRINEAVDFVGCRTPSPMEDPNLSRNAASSRAIPVSKMIEQVMKNPAVPLFWGKNVAGMQANEELPPHLIEKAKTEWLWARDAAVHHARQLMQLDQDWDERWTGCHKQIVNRLLEPFTHITVAFTAVKWQNFFKLRIHPAAEPHIKLLAQAIKRAIDAAPTEVLRYGEWHTPMATPDEEGPVVRSVARLARMSYLKHDGTESSFEQDQELHDRLLKHDPMHASPAEHQCSPDSFSWSKILPNDHRVWDTPEWHGNLTGFIQYRKTLPGEADHG